MADKPSRSVIFYGDGFARFVDPSNTNIHSLAVRGSCGFLSLPHAPPETENERIFREFAHLVDASQAYEIANGLKAKGNDNNKISTLSERFMGVKAALVTDSTHLTSFGKLIGFDVFQHNEISSLSELLRLVGFEGGKCLEVSPYDLVFVHIGVDENRGLGVIDYSIGSIITTMDQPGSEIRSRLHLSLVLSYGSITEKDASVFNVKTLQEDVNGAFVGLIPRQSYTMRGAKTRDDVRDYCPMLVAQWQHAVTRKDLVDTLSFESIKKLGSNLVIPADRFIHEVAFKLWKAPKYGA